MYYRINNSKLIDFADFMYDDNCKQTFIISSDELKKFPDKVIVQDGELILNPNFKNELAKRERKRLDSLFMTRGDFFDGTIKAFGVDEDDLRPAIENLLATLPLSDIEKKVSLNRFKNAKDFYRGHELFKIISGRELNLENGSKIKVSSARWDRFFDEAVKKNPEAYRELMPIEELKEETEELLNDNSTNATILPE